MHLRIVAMPFTITDRETWTGNERGNGYYCSIIRNRDRWNSDFFFSESGFRIDWKPRRGEIRDEIGVGARSRPRMRASNVHRSESRNARWLCIESDIIRERIQIIKVNESPFRVVSSPPWFHKQNKRNASVNILSVSCVSVRCCAYVVDNVSFPRLIRIHDVRQRDRFPLDVGGEKVGWFFFAPVPLSCDSIETQWRENGASR